MNIYTIINQVLSENFNLNEENGIPMKQNKVDTHYEDRSFDKRENCGNCGWFIKENNSCGIVEGRISPYGWCRLWGTKSFCK
jgi:hypothetical protein